MQTVVADQNARSQTGLIVPLPAESVPRDRTYEAGKSVQEIIAQMAAVEDGPYFVEDPYLEPARPDWLARLIIRWPDSGTDRPGVRFEYGEGTLANVSGYTVTGALPLNGVTYTGGAVEGDVPLRRAEDAASIARYGLFEGWFDDPDVTIPETLQEKAAERLRPEPGRIVELELVPAGPVVGGSPPPRLWRDFDIGDTVYASIRDNTTELFDVPLLVAHARLSVSENDDSEQLELTLQTPGGDDAS